MSTVKTRKKSSPIWLLPENEFIELIKKSKRMKDVLAFFGLLCKGGNFRTVTSRIQSLGLDTSHFLTRIESSNYARIKKQEDFEAQFLTKACERTRTQLKKYLLKFKSIPYICRDCNNSGEWNNKPLSLQLEHINGISNDNTLSNLCFLCPNCHSQTETFAGKNCKKVKTGSA